MNAKNTKRAWLTSVVSIVICLSMLVGSTFAWFTDTASVSVNAVQSGNLEVLLVDKNGYSLEGQTLDFVKAEGHEEEAVLWEPGCTYELPAVYVKNNGNLHIKYKIEITGIAGDAELNEAIEWTYNGLALDTEYTLAPDTTSEAIVISGHMKEEAGNEYMDKTIEGIAITVYATQNTAEFDSFDNQYDIYAEYEITGATTQEELNELVKNATEKTLINIGEGTFTVPGNIGAKDIVFKGTEKTVIDMTQAVGTNGATLTFDGVTVEIPDNANYTGLQHTAKVVYRDCVINGQQTMYAPEVLFENCVFNNLTNAYCVWTYGATDATFNNCTFNTSGKAILVYTEGETHANITVNNCVFNDDESVELEKAAVEIGSSPYSADTTYNVYINDCTVTGFAVNDEGYNTGSTLWGNKNSMDDAHLNVVIDGVDVY